jgi:amicyanin
LAAAALAAAAAVLPAHAADMEVRIDNFSFSPERITVKAGTTVTWINEDDIPHAVASSAKLFKSKVLDTEDKYSFTFTAPGSYQYFCSLHPHMTGTIVVEAVTGSNPADRFSSSVEPVAEQRLR